MLVDWIPFLNRRCRAASRICCLRASFSRSLLSLSPIVFLIERCSRLQNTCRLTCMVAGAMGCPGGRPSDGNRTIRRPETEPGVLAFHVTVPDRTPADRVRFGCPYFNPSTLRLLRDPPPGLFLAIRIAGMVVGSSDTMHKAEYQFERSVHDGGRSSSALNWLAMRRS